MKAEIKFVKTRDFIKTTASGQLNLEQSKKVLEEIARLNTPDDLHDILVDIRGTEPGLSLSDIYELVTAVGNHRQAFRKKIAILLGAQHDFDKARFLEMCASNRGYNVNAFDDFEEAVNWLMCEDGE